MLTDEEALLFAIRKEPVRDLPRLVYADFLDERGSPGDADRADFVRNQCEEADVKRSVPREQWCDWGIGSDCRKCRRCELERLGRESLTSHEVAWSRPWRTVAAVWSLRIGGGSCCHRYADEQRCNCVADAPVFAWSCGFVRVVATSQARFTGGACPHCSGSGRLSIHGRTHGHCER